VAVYVDSMRAAFSRMIMCHMLADTDDELHAMADLIGVARKWHQAPPRHESHYDIALSKRALAVRHGAREITWLEAGAMTLRRRVTGELGKPEEALGWVRMNRTAARAASEQRVPARPTAVAANDSTEIG
jgi:hypothetical protein